MERGAGNLANKSCGVEIWRNRRRFRRAHLFHFRPVQGSLHGRIGAVKVITRPHVDCELLPASMYRGKGHREEHSHCVDLPQRRNWLAVERGLRAGGGSREPGALLEDVGTCGGHDLSRVAEGHRPGYDYELVPLRPHLPWTQELQLH
eukprot:7064682-Pyramimonas_sp.AAC.1